MFSWRQSFLVGDSRRQAKLPRRAATFFLRRSAPDFDILIIDDENDFLCTMELWFKAHGYLVEAIDNSFDALDILSQRTPHIVLLDDSLPSADGFQMLKKIRKIEPRLPVVMLTSEITEEKCLSAYQAGANALLEKSLDFYKTESIINSLVRIVSRQKS